MPTLRRQVIVVLALALATGLLLVTGGLWRVFGWISDLAPGWRGQAAVDVDREREERLIRLNVENVVLRRRLQEYGEIKGSSAFPAIQEVIARGTVTVRTLRQGRRYCELDVGAMDGVAVGDPVVLGWSLVGRVSGISQSRCLVQTVADAESRVPAALYSDETVLAEGVLRGTGEPGVARLDHIEDRPDLLVVPGQRVVTASLGGLPAGLVLGTVRSATRGEGGAHWRIDVDLLRNPDAVESLIVIRSK